LIFIGFDFLFWGNLQAKPSFKSAESRDGYYGLFTFTATNYYPPQPTTNNVQRIKKQLLDNRQKWTFDSTKPYSVFVGLFLQNLSILTLSDFWVDLILFPRWLQIQFKSQVYFFY
jgi:hypothetical protein